MTPPNGRAVTPRQVGIASPPRRKRERRGGSGGLRAGAARHPSPYAENERACRGKRPPEKAEARKPWTGETGIAFKGGSDRAPAVHGLDGSAAKGATGSRQRRNAMSLTFMRGVSRYCSTEWRRVSMSTFAIMPGTIG